MYKKASADLLKTINECTCSFTTVLYAMERLKSAGFRELKLQDIHTWSVNKGDRVYINIFDSSLFAFVIGDTSYKSEGGQAGEGPFLRLAAAHTDSPALYIKPNPEITAKAYGKVNVEVYGGAILNTWLDRPLSMAGKLALKGRDIFNPETVVIDFKKNLFTVPNLAIHLNREINKGIELNKQNDMLPLCTVLEDKLNEGRFFLDYMAKELDVQREDILDYELYIYNNEAGCILGLNEELVSAPRIDNISSVTALLNAVTEAQRECGINGIVLYDNEEIGSRSKQGADSRLLSMVLERICGCLGLDREKYLHVVTAGFLLSSDVAHALHPNHGEKSDVTNVNLLNGGVVIKRASSQSYATDCSSIAVVEQLCRTAGIPYQKFSGRSDTTLGSTLGNITNKYLPMRTVDIGIPLLAMHSARETMGIKDQYYLENLVTDFFRVG